MKTIEFKLNAEEYGHLVEYANFFKVSVSEMALAMYQAGFNKITEAVMQEADSSKKSKLDEELN